MSDSQKFIARNRAPRVQIEYDVELYGAQKKVQLPFVMGVLSDLSGKSEQPPVSERGFLEIDVDNFDDRMRAMAPKAQFSVPNTLTGEGNLAVDLTFQKMSDFSPEAIAQNVDSLRPLLEARRQLSDLMAYMDGKSGAEALIENLLSQPALLEALTGAATETSETDKALESLKANMPAEQSATDDTASALASLAALSPEDAPEDTSLADALNSLQPPPEAEETDDTGDILSNIERIETQEVTDTTDNVLAAIEAVETHETPDATADILAALERAPEEVESDTATDVLSAIDRIEDTAAPQDGTADVLASIETIETPEKNPDTVSDVLATIESVEETAEVDTTADVLASLDAVELPVEDQTKTEDILATIEPLADDGPALDDTADVLAGLETVETSEDETDTLAAALSTIAPIEEVVEADSTDDVLAGLEPVDTETEDPADLAASVLAGLEPVVEPDEAVDQADDILAGIELTTPETDTVEDGLDDILAGLDSPVPDTDAGDSLDDVLAGLDAVDLPVEDMDQADDILSAIEPIIDEAPASDDTADVLAGLETLETVETDGEPTDDLAAALSTIDVIEDITEPDTTNDVLAGLEPVVAPDQAENQAGDILAGIEPATPETDTDQDGLDDILAGLDSPVQDADAGDSLDDVLAGLDAPTDASAPEDSLDDILGSLDTAPEETQATDSLDDILSGLDTPETSATNSTGLDDVLASIDAGSTPQDTPGDDLDDILNTLEQPADPSTTADDTADVLANLDTTAPAPPKETALDDTLASIDLAEPDSDVTSESIDDILGDLEVSGTQETVGDDLDDILAGLDPASASDEVDSGLDDILASLDSADAVQEDDNSSLDDILGDLDTQPEPQEDVDDLDSLLAGLDEVADDAPEDAATDDLHALLAHLDMADPEPSETADGDLDALLAELEAPGSQEDLDDLDALLADPEPNDADTAEDDLDALLADLEDSTPEPTDDTAPEDDLDALLADLEGDSIASDEDDLDALLADVADTSPAAPPKPTAPAQSPFGVITAPRPARDDLNRGKFRMAVFGDFTGRAARGLLQTGSELAARAPIELDVDTIEEVIEGFATTLNLPIGKDGTGIEIRLKEFDDLHPDELYDNVEIFKELAGLRQQLGIGSMAEKARERLKGWGEEFGTPIRLPKHSASTSVPANKKLSDFQALIGDTRGSLTQASPADEIIARIVGPHIVKAPDAGSEAMLAAVDDALSSAMRLVLHHPDFQAVEAQWRSLDLLARRIETDSKLQIVLYDVSAEELATDLAAQEDLSQSGFYQLLTDVLDPEEGAGGFSALFGLYTFEETPPHAELLARIASVAAHVDAPFFTAMTSGYLATPKEERHPLVAQAWDTLRALPEAAYLGLTTPRFLLRLPYGKKSDPISPFDFEEFTPQEGLSGMLWANPVVLVAILLAGTYKKDGKAMELGSMMSLGDMPFHYMTDRYGDQVALPCTERNLTSDPAQVTLARGFMPVVWVKGRNEIRLGSFRALGGDEIAGPWSGTVPSLRKAPETPVGDIEIELDAGTTQHESEESLDDLLAAFDDDTDADVDTDEMDPELAALLEGL